MKKFTERMLIILIFIPAMVFSGTFFELVIGEDLEGQQYTSKPIVNKIFFQCHSQSDCQYVAKTQDSQDLKTFPSGYKFASSANFSMLWKKTKIVSNLALRKPATLSSLYHNLTVASHAVDGDRSTEFYYCAQSKSDDNSWLRVDLGQPAVIKSVLVISFKPRVMKRFSIKVGNSHADGGKSNPACVEDVPFSVSITTLAVDCQDEIVGRYVTFIVNGFLELCELEVLGYFLP